MAFDTFSLWHMAIPLNNTEMASLTGHSPRNIFPVIEVPTFDLDVPFRLNMAGSAAPYGTRNAFFFPSWTSFVIVADETVNLMNSKVFPLYELGVTGGASKFHPPS